MKTKLYFIFYTSIIKTFFFNVKYFGFKSLFKPRIFISRNVKLKKVKGNIVISKNAKKCHIGYATNYLFSSKSTKTIFYNEGTITLNGNLCVSKGCSIVVKKAACLTFGNDVHISQNTQIECHLKIDIHDNCVISWDCLIIDSDTHPIFDNKNNLLNPNKPIELKNGSWVCARSIILKGASLGEGCVLSAGSTLTKKIDDRNSIVVNNNVVKKDININMEKDIL